jgi:chromosome segregation ATPase
MKIRTAIAVALLGTVCWFSADTAFAQGAMSSRQPQSKNEDALKALLEEVHLLRLTFERMNQNSSRVQILLAQMRVKQEHVDQIAQQIEDTRSEIGNVQLSQSRSVDQLKELREKIEESKTKADPDSDVTKMEAEYKSIQSGIEQQQQQMNQLGEREARLNTQLQSEQNALSAIEDKLDKLERELAAQQ